MATYAIGDIHGNIAALDELLNQLDGELNSGDEVIFLGDYIDRGFGSKDVIDRIVHYKASSGASVITLLGNHEQAMLDTREDHSSHSWIFTNSGFATILSYSPEANQRIREALGNYGVRVLMERINLPYDLFFDAMPDSHHKFFDNLMVYHRNQDGIFVHGGLEKGGGPLETQSIHDLINGPNGFPEEYKGRETVVYGHHNNAIINRDGLPEPRIINNTIGIDMSRYGFLCAFRLTDRVCFRSPA